MNNLPSGSLEDTFTLYTDKKLEIPVKSYSSSLMDLVNYGAKDVILSTQNTSPFFKIVYKQVTPQPFFDFGYNNDQNITTQTSIVVEPPKEEDPQLVTISFDDLDGAFKRATLLSQVVL